MGCKGSTLNSSNRMGNSGSNSSGAGKDRGNGGSNSRGSTVVLDDDDLGAMTIRGKVGERGEEVIFGSGVHVGRAGNVNLTGRKMNFLGTNIVNMINEDDLHRKATSLTLSNNALYTLGKEISLLPDLEAIEMDSNKFTRLPEMLTKLPKLASLDVSVNPIDPIRGFDVAPRLLALRALILRDCNMTVFPARVLECVNLELLDISDNPGIDLHDVAISNLAKIKSLNVANCGLSGRQLPVCIRRASSITTLDISGNNFDFLSDVTGEFFGKSLPKSLRTLHLRDMQLHSVPPVVAKLKSLSYLDLAMNPIETLDVLAGRVVKRLPRPGSTGTMGLGTAVNSPQSCQAGARSDVGGAGARGHVDVEPAGSGPLTRDMGGKDDDNLSTASSRMSISKVSRAGMIAPVSHPIPLKKLSLRSCGLRTVPKYFHKMTNLEELDLSENDQLDDPNMTLFSLQNLRVLNVIGCPFAEDPSKSRNEWFDIAKLGRLADLQWELWKGDNNMSPYRTKIPIEICGLSLRRINLVRLRRDLFVGNTVETVINLLSDGYFKVDLAVDDNTLYSHIEAIKAFVHGESFFSPQDIHITGASGATTSNGAGGATSADRAKGGGGGDAGILIHGNELGQVHLRIAINRYIFFLAMQAANYDAVIIPPLDVMIIHYSQITCNPAKYRADCEAICGRILNCNYRAFFLEQKRHPQAARDAVAASKKIWNLMVRSAQTELAWLRYDFWDKRARQTAAAQPTVAASGRQSSTHSAVPFATAMSSNGSPKMPSRQPSFANTSFNAAARIQSLPYVPCGSGDTEMYHDFTELRAIDSTSDLCGVLDQAITSHFLEQGDEVFRDALTDFFLHNHSVNRHSEVLSQLTLDWTRYVKYLALYAYRISMCYENDSTVVMQPMADDDGNLCAPIGPPKRSTSLLGPHYDRFENNSFAGPGKYLPLPQQQANPYDEEAAERRPSFLARRTSSSLSNASRIAAKKRDSERRTNIKLLDSNPIPTIGISLLLHAHRTTHVKYFQTLSLLGIDDVDITWEESDRCIDMTCKAWKAVYDEAYINASSAFMFRCKNGVIAPFARAMDGNVTSRVFIPERQDSDGSFRGEVYSPHLKPTRSILQRRRAKKDNSDKKVRLCGGDTEFGVF